MKLFYHPIRDDLSSELPARPTHAAPLRGLPSGTMPTSAVSNGRFRRLCTVLMHGMIGSAATFKQSHGDVADSIH